jgi:hypothetical protein
MRSSIFSQMGLHTQLPPLFSKLYSMVLKSPTIIQEGRSKLSFITNKEFQQSTFSMYLTWIYILMMEALIHVSLHRRKNNIQLVEQWLTSKSTWVEAHSIIIPLEVPSELIDIPSLFFKKKFPRAKMSDSYIFVSSKRIAVVFSIMTRYLRASTSTLILKPLQF